MAASLSAGLVCGLGYGAVKTPSTRLGSFSAQWARSGGLGSCNGLVRKDPTWENELPSSV